MFTRLLEEDPRSQDEGIFLNMELGGTRDAEQNFELMVTQAVTDAGCVPDVAVRDLSRRRRDT